MNRKILTLALSGGNLGVSVAMSVAVAFIPFAYEGADPGILGPDGEQVITSLSAIDVNGIRVVPLLFAHIVAAAYFFFQVNRDPSGIKMPRLTAYLFVAGFAAYSVITFNTFGLFYIPSAGIALVTALVYSSQTFPEPAPLPARQIARSSSPAGRKRRSGRRNAGRRKK